MEDFYKVWLQHNPQTRLSADEEKVLGEKIQSGKALAAKKKNCCLSQEEQLICSEGEKALKRLILCNIPLGIYFANKYASKYPDIGLSLDDISQEALMGVMKAAERYDPKADCKFSTYAAFWIGQTIRRAIEDKSDAIRKPASAHSRARLVHKIESEANFTLSAAEIAEMAGLSEEEVVFIRELDQQKIMSMDAGYFDDGEDEQSYHETIASSANIEEETNRKMQHEMLAALIKMIPDPDTRDIMLMHLGMNESGAVFSNKTIAVIKNKKESEIVAIIKSAEHELCRWQAVHNKMSGGTAD